jgi:hypothetical protein
MIDGAVWKLNAGDGVKILICYLHNMERGGKVMVVLLLVLALTAGTQATRTSGASSSDGPYRAIMDRNVFDLRPMPVKDNTAAAPTPPPNVKLVGLMMITGHPQAVLSIADPTAPTKPPVSYVLSEEQRQASVEVKSINMEAETARVQIAGDVVQLKLEKDVKAAAGPGPAAAPGMAGQPGQGRFVPGARGGGRGAFPVPAPGGPAAPVPGYNPSSSSPSASYQPGVSPTDNSTLPTRPVRTDATDPSQDAMTPEQSLAQVEQTRQAYQQNNDPRALLLPSYGPQQQQPGGGDTSTGGQPEQSGPTPPQFTPPFGSHATGSLMPH